MSIQLRPWPAVSAVGVILCVLVVLVGEVASAQRGDKGPAGGQYDFRSKRYQVTSDLPRKSAQEFASYMDAMGEQYERVISGFPIKNAQPVRLYLFDENAAYLAALQAKGFNASNTGGVFFHSQDQTGLAVFEEGQERERIEATLRHEGFHQFAFLRIGSGLPTWANEGLAEYFSEGLLVRGQIRVGLAPWMRLERVQQAINEGKAFGFGEFLRMDGQEWMNRVNAGDVRSGVMYDQAWSIAHFLMHGDNGKYADAFRAFLRACANGMQLEQALRSAFGTTDFSAFENAWKRSILAMQPDPLSATVERLRFLAYGLLWLHKGGINPASMEELKAELRSKNFEVTYQLHGAVRVQSAFDDAYFQPPAAPSGAKPVVFIFTGAAPNLPATVKSQGLAVQAGIKWIKNDDGELDFQIVVN